MDPSLPSCTPSICGGAQYWQPPGWLKPKRSNPFLDSAFSEVALSASFAALPASRLDELLAHDDLGVREEEDTFNALEAWINGQVRLQLIQR